MEVLAHVSVHAGPSAQPPIGTDMRNYADGADAACVKKWRNIRICVKFMLKFTRKTHKVTILRDNWYLIHSSLVKMVSNRRIWWKFTKKNCQKCTQCHIMGIFPNLYVVIYALFVSEFTYTKQGIFPMTQSSSKRMWGGNLEVPS